MKAGALELWSIKKQLACHPQSKQRGKPPLLLDGLDAGLCSNGMGKIDRADGEIRRRVNATQ
jgi:hypothetical protein